MANVLRNTALTGRKEEAFSVVSSAVPVAAKQEVNIAVLYSTYIVGLVKNFLIVH